MAKDSYLSRLRAGVAFGGAFGAAYGVLHGINSAFNRGTYDTFNRNPFSRRIPGLLKIRHVGQVTLGWTITFGFLGGVGGSLIHYDMSQKENSSDITNNKSHS